MNRSESFQLGRRINESAEFMRAIEMRDHYDFSDSKPNPYAGKIKKQITIRLDSETIEYFKSMADDKGIPYQSLINLYLRDCAKSNRDLQLSWN